MKICLISILDERVPPKLYGGVGRIVSMIIEGLVKKGHEVTLLAPGTSDTSACLIPTIDKPLGVDNEYHNIHKAREAYFQLATAKIIKVLLKEKFDIINNHLGWRLIPFGSIVPAPFITTLHAPPDEMNKKIVFEHCKDAPIISISNNQRKPLPDVNYITTIYNGIDITLYNFSEKSGDYLVFLGRISPEKGILEAIQIAKELGLKLKIAAAIHSWDRRYFEAEISPHIDGTGIIFLGEISDKEKNDLLGKAKAMLAPIQWEEPFGLTFIEAMACGTPVITLNRGSAEEVVIDKETGIVANSVQEIIRRFPEVEKISRLNCRQRVEKNFTLNIMVDNYESLFKDYLKKHATTKQKI